MENFKTEKNQWFCNFMENKVVKRRFRRVERIIVEKNGNCCKLQLLLYPFRKKRDKKVDKRCQSIE